MADDVLLGVFGVVLILIFVFSCAFCKNRSHCNRPQPTPTNSYPGYPVQSELREVYISGVRSETRTARSSRPATVEVRSRSVSTSEAATRPTAAPNQGGVRSRSVSCGKKASRTNQTEQRLFGEFHCNQCNRYWMSGYSWANTSQKCRRCNTWVPPFKQTELLQSENKSDISIPHPQELCGKCTQLGRFCGRGNYYMD